MSRAEPQLPATTPDKKTYVSSIMTVFIRILFVLASLAIVATGPVRADQKDSAVFDLTLKGIHAGTLSISGAMQGSSYAVAGVLKSGGLVALVRKVRYDAKAQGNVRGNSFTPVRYQEDANTGKRRSQSTMEYVGGVPKLKAYNPPRPARETGIDPSTQGGTVDPLTALYAALRDVPASEACTLRIFMFDGQRRSQVVLAKPQKNGNEVTCNGEYRRLEGFSTKEMSEKQRFAFRLRYEPAENGFLRVTEISMDTLYGKGRLNRR
jgi:hypothetical protein